MPKPRKPPPARGAALNALDACLNRHQDAQAAVDRAVAGLRDARDAGLATELTYGVLRLLSRLDALLDHHLKQPGKLPPKARMVLRTAAYELTRLDRVPDYATLDWAVEAVKARHGQGLGKLANGLLRNIQRLGADANSPGFYAARGDETASLARWYACPPWLVEHWQKDYGPERARLLLEAQLEPPPVGVRVNVSRPGAHELAGGLAQREDCVLAKGRTLAFAPGAALDNDLFENGAASRQSAAAQLALAALNPEAWPAPVWDACAGRGGKTLALAELGVGPLWASDVAKSRLQQLSPQAHRIGVCTPFVFRADADADFPLKNAPKTILLDVPCSGLGVISRRPDTKWKRKPADLDKLAKLQKRMLHRAAAFLPAGGRLAVITCTTAAAENQDRVRELLQSQSGLELAVERPIDAAEPLREFFYAALLEKRA